MATAMLLQTTIAHAVPFGSFDPRSMAMGGAGVAVASPGSAPLFNPALLSIANEDDDFAIELPIVGVRVYDPDEFADAVDEFDDAVMDNLDMAIDNYNFTPGDSTDAVNALIAVDNEVMTLDDKPFQFDGGVGLVVSIPGKKTGFAVVASATATITGIVNYNDADTVASLTSDMLALDDCYAGPAGDFTSCVTVPGKFTYVDTDPVSPAFGEVIFTAQSDSGEDSDIKSTVRVIGVALAEIGLSFSHEMAMFGTDVAVGLTPKAVSVTVIDYEANVDSADSDDVEADDYTADYTDFNLDAGIAIDHKNGWRSGFVIKNIISRDYEAMNTDPATGIETATGMTISLKPQVRAGISHTTSWSTFALDMDLTKNEGLGLIDDDSQYVAMGLELDAYDSAQLRFGYRADTVNSDRNVASAGIGLSPFGVHIDLGVAGNKNEVGASFQLGFRF